MVYVSQILVAKPEDDHECCVVGENNWSVISCRKLFVVSRHGLRPLRMEPRRQNCVGVINHYVNGMSGACLNDDSR